MWIVITVFVSENCDEDKLEHKSLSFHLKPDRRTSDLLGMDFCMSFGGRLAECQPLICVGVSAKPSNVQPSYPGHCDSKVQGINSCYMSMDHPGFPLVAVSQVK